MSIAGVILSATISPSRVIAGHPRSPGSGVLPTRRLLAYGQNERDCFNLFRTEQCRGTYAVTTTSGYRVQLLPIDALRKHEEHDAIYALQLSRTIESDGVVSRPVVVEERSFTLLDGHHRVAALMSLGCRYAPCILLDYEDPRITLDSWNPDHSVCRGMVLHAAAHGPLLPPKTTRHTFAPDLGEISIGLDMLLADSPCTRNGPQP